MVEILRTEKNIRLFKYNSTNANIIRFRYMTEGIQTGTGAIKLSTYSGKNTQLLDYQFHNLGIVLNK